MLRKLSPRHETSFYLKNISCRRCLYPENSLLVVINDENSKPGRKSQNQPTTNFRGHQRQRINKRNIDVTVSLISNVIIVVGTKEMKSEKKNCWFREVYRNGFKLGGKLYGSMNFDYYRRK